MARRGKLVVVLAAAGSLLIAVGLVGVLWARSDGGSGERLDDGSLHPVAGNFEPDETQLADCSGDFGCLEQAFGNVAFRDGPESAIRLFDERIRTDPNVESNCHRIAHTIGSATLARFDGNVGRAFTAGSAICSSGYYHGLLERAFAGISSDEELARSAGRICDEAEITRTTYFHYQCIHGLGHGLMITTAYDLPYSLSVCDRLATPWAQVSCTGGVFMENISSSYGFESRWLRDDDPVYPCNTVARPHKEYCYLMVTSRILELNNFDWSATAAECNRVEDRWVDVCFQSYGRDASGFSRQNVTRVLSLCRIAGRGQKECLYGAARDMANDYARGGAQRAANLCSRAPTRLRARCFFGLGTILGTFGSAGDGRGSVCRDVPQKDVRSCRRGAGEAS
jgi:hypothetical protein